MNVVLIVLLSLIGVLVFLLLVAVARTLFNGKKLEIKDNFSTEIANEMVYAQKLATMCTYKTIAVKGGGQQEIFDDYFAKVKEMFPKFFSVAKQIDLKNVYLFKIKGKSSEKPTMFMAHSDVVEAQGEWTHPAFAGTIADGKIWGRGTMDIKGLLCAILCALEEKLEQGFVPQNDLYVMSTVDEEVFGIGAPNVKEYFASQNIKIDLIVDEGGAITDKALPGIENDTALLGVCEKGYLDVKFVAISNGGHSSTPPRNTPIARLAAFVNEIETKKIFPQTFIKPIKEMLEQTSRYMKFPLRLVLGNIWLFGGLLKKVLPKISGQLAAMLKTTIVFTMASGSGAANVIPQSAEVVANLRILPGETKEEVWQKLEKIAKKYNISMTELVYKPVSKVADVNSEGYVFLKQKIEEHFSGTIVSPYVMLAGTDCCKLDEISNTTLRFSPIRASKAQVSSIHAIDENCGVRELAKGVEFLKDVFAQL